PGPPRPAQSSSSSEVTPVVVVTPNGAMLTQPAVTVLPGANPPRDPPTRAMSTRIGVRAPVPNSTQAHPSFSDRPTSGIEPSSTVSSARIGAAVAAPAPSTAQAAVAAVTAATRSPVEIIVVLLVWCSVNSAVTASELPKPDDPL